MRSTLTLPSNRKAVLDIPYAALNANKPPQTHTCCDAKIVLTAPPNRNIDLRRMVDELEEAYESDTRELNAKITQLQAEKADSEREKAAAAAQHGREMASLREELAAQAAAARREAEVLRAQLAEREAELARAREEKEVVVRSKISEFRQQEYIDRLAHQDQLIRLRDLELQELLVKLQGAQNERTLLQEQSLAARIRLETEVSRLSLELTESSKRHVADQSTFSYASRLRQDDALKQAQELRLQLQASERALRDTEAATEAKTRQLAVLTESLRSQELKAADLQTQLAQLNESNSKLEAEVRQLGERLSRSSEAVGYLDEEKGRLLLEMEDRLVEISRLRGELAGRERVYEVKVERVIDGKQQIDELQAAVFELEQQLKLFAQEKEFLAEDLRKKQAELQETVAGRVRLEGEIAGLKAYIAKREGSFRWAVEREIEKDIAVGGQRSQLYKVSQVGEYSRVVQETGNFIQKQIAANLQNNLFANCPEQIILQQQYSAQKYVQ